MHHFHVAKYFLVFFTHNAYPHSVEQLLVHLLFLVCYFCLVKDGFRLMELIIILGPKVFQRLPLIFAKVFMINFKLLNKEICFDLRLCLFLAINVYKLLFEEWDLELITFYSILLCYKWCLGITAHFYGQDFAI